MLCRVTLTALGILHSHSLVFVKTKECETENYVFGSKIGELEERPRTDAAHKPHDVCVSGQFWA